MLKGFFKSEAKRGKSEAKRDAQPAARVTVETQNFASLQNYRICRIYIFNF